MFLSSYRNQVIYTCLEEAQNTNSFENGLKEPTDTNLSITEKKDQNKIPADQQNFDTYYNSI